MRSFLFHEFMAYILWHSFTSLHFQAQKPWMKRYNKLMVAKKEYHSACKQERSTANQENNAKGDPSIPVDQVSFLSVYYCLKFCFIFNLSPNCYQNSSNIPHSSTILMHPRHFNIKSALWLNVAAVPSKMREQFLLGVIHELCRESAVVDGWLCLCMSMDELRKLKSMKRYSPSRKIWWFNLTLTANVFCSCCLESPQALSRWKPYRSSVGGLYLWFEGPPFITLCHTDSICEHYIKGTHVWNSRQIKTIILW